MVCCLWSLNRALHHGSPTLCVLVILAAQGSYDTLGWVTSESADNAASLTLEYAFDDAVLANMAKFMGDTETYNTFSKRSMNYKQVVCAWLTMAECRVDSVLV